MAGNTEILIKRSLSTGNNTPVSLNQGELAFSYKSNTLFIGTEGSDSYLEIGSWSNLANLTAGTYGDTTNIPIITVDAHGTVTNVTTSAISTTLNLSSDDGSNTMSLLDGTLTISGGEGITTSIDGNSTVLIDVDNTVVRSNTAGANQTIDGDVNISGNLVVLGTQTTVDSTTVTINDPLLLLANNNTQDVLDIGTIGQYSPDGGSTILRTGVYRHAGDQQYYIFDGYSGDISANTVNPADASFHLATLNANVNSRLVQSDAFLAAQGSPDGYGNAGYSFKNDGGFDTGMFSQKDGSIQLWTNNQLALNINPDNDGTSFGYHAGLTNQGYRAIALGYQAADTNQGNFAVALGLHAGQDTQGTTAVAIGHSAGQYTQGQDAIAVGGHAGQGSQGYRATAVGYRAAYGDTTAQGQYAVALGAFAGYDHQSEYSIAINATGNNLNTPNPGLFIDPIRLDTSVSSNVLAYNTTTKEIVSSNVTINDTGITLANGTLIADSTDAGLFIDSLNAAETSNIVFYNTDTKELTYGTMADLRPDRIANNTFYWEVDGTTGTLISDAGTQIADSANSVIIGTNVGIDNSNADRVAIGNYAGQTNQGWRSTAVGYGAGNSNQNYFATALGMNAGNSGQGSNSVAVGHAAAENGQSGSAVAVGFAAGVLNQGFASVAVGRRAGWQYQSNYSAAVGAFAGQQNQGGYAVAMGYQSGNQHQGSGSVAIGDNAGYNYLSADGIAIGTNAGYNNNGSNGWAPIAIGRYAGEEYSGDQSVAIGNHAGQNSLGYRSVAIGHYAAGQGSGQQAIAIGDQAGNYQGEGSIALGRQAGDSAGNYSIAIGYEAGWYDVTPLGQYQIAIGAYASQAYGYDNSIVLNASGDTLDATASGLFIKPVRYTATQDATNDGLMFYNQSTGEVRYSYTLDGGSF